MALVPKTDLNEKSTKAMAAFLNSTFNQLYIEKEGRTTGGGVVATEINHLEELPIINLQKCTEKEIDCLAALFDNLESRARECGGAVTKNNLDELEPEITAIDKCVVTILGLPVSMVQLTKQLTNSMIERRIVRASRPNAKYVLGESESKIVPPADDFGGSDYFTRSLDHWI